MPTVLITGARAPAALELARSFRTQGWTVHSADSFRYTLTAPAVQRHFRVPAPRTDLAGFRRHLTADLIVPTCEEVFYLAGLPGAFCGGLPLLRRLHSKWEFLDLARDCDIGIPDSRLATSPDDLPPRPEAFVCKREFSRFGSYTLVGRAVCRPTPSERWVVQERLHGEEFSAYGVARSGRLTAFAMYLPLRRFASSTYFRPTRDDQALAFARALVAELGFTGQISFDFMRNRRGTFVLECNPRACSGVHLLPDVAQAILGDDWVEQSQRERGLEHVLWGRPALALLPHLAETLWRSLSRRQSFKAASTSDIEWDGEPF